MCLASYQDSRLGIVAIPIILCSPFFAAVNTEYIIVTILYVGTYSVIFFLVGVDSCSQSRDLAMMTSTEHRIDHSLNIIV